MSRLFLFLKKSDLEERKYLAEATAVGAASIMSPKVLDNYIAAIDESIGVAIRNAESNIRHGEDSVEAKIEAGKRVQQELKKLFPFVSTQKM